jgi:N-acetylglucosaminyl-diphospho-decaprenol L-rhamnosyltransferase
MASRRGAKPDVAAVVVTYDSAAWIERCLSSLGDAPTVVVDDGSTDGTVQLVRERFPDVRVVEAENRGLAAGWNTGIRETEGRYVLLMNADAWLVGDALSRLVTFADRRPQAAIVAPRLLNLDGSLQRSVRGFPTLWRLATEYFFLRKLAPRSEALNGFYAAGFDHDEVREAEFVMGACMLVRRSAIEQVGLLDEDYFLFSEETDWCYRVHRVGWQVVFFPGAECMHVGGGSHGGRFYQENLRGHLLFFWKHRGPRKAERARRLLLAALKLRAKLFRGERGRMYQDASDWLASGDVAELLGK